LYFLLSSQLCLCPLYMLYLTIYTSSVSFRFSYISGLTNPSMYQPYRGVFWSRPLVPRQRPGSRRPGTGCLQGSKHITTLYRKFETYIPRNETARSRYKFQHSCICERFICSQDQSLADRSWEYINRSQIHECCNWETEHYNSVLAITRPRSYWEYINRNQTFILDSRRPFILNACSFKHNENVTFLTVFLSDRN
jgi:hypothetical protein